ncbi:hypothetical protein EVAR_9300_1 [Eumeta japonica]|uniref:Uncharacterized protein n=1 Tax=Eumeta variegata TaxID=151549 RepID=A0A4C1TLY5_EUMVA|nr:hypothetical protein EVAR_9300_1 [Eumeta japonica]
MQTSIAVHGHSQPRRSTSPASGFVIGVSDREGIDKERVGCHYKSTPGDTQASYATDSVILCENLVSNLSSRPIFVLQLNYATAWLYHFNSNSKE